MKNNCCDFEVDFASVEEQLRANKIYSQDVKVSGARVISDMQRLHLE